jgi:DNA-directed RNA polymerase subunit K/omega
MAQEGFDTLMQLTESRYRLSMVTARRAAQLKAGIPSVLPKDEQPRTRNTVTIAMKELESGAGRPLGRRPAKHRRASQPWSSASGARSRAATASRGVPETTRTPTNPAGLRPPCA